MKEWTIMVYMAGDNNLSEEMISALIGMKDAMKAKDSDERVNLVAVYDSGYPTVDTTHYCFRQKTAAEELTKSAVDYKPVRRDLQKRKRPSEKAYIIDFVRWVKRDYPARNYAMIMSGHSDGIIGRTIFRDSNPDTSMNIRQLEYILAKCKRYLGQKFAFLGFDSCLMNMVEVAAELKDHAEVIVGSEGNVPTSGWSYQPIIHSSLRAVRNRDGLTPRNLANSIVKEFVHYSKEFNVGGRSVNISACDTSKLDKVGVAITDLARLFNKILDAPVKVKRNATIQERKAAEGNALVREMFKTLIQKSHYDSQTFMYEQAVDIVDFATTLKSNCDIAANELTILCGSSPGKIAITYANYLNGIKTKCDKVIVAIDECIFAHGFAGASFQFSKGLSVFFPWTALAFLMLFSRYKRLKFSRTRIEWIKFIGKFSVATYRPSSLPRFLMTPDYTTWCTTLADEQSKDVGFKDVGFKDVGFKDVGFKDVGFKDVGYKDVGFKDVGFKNVSPGGGGDSDFYFYFRRFRNHPIDHDVSDLIIR